MPLTLLSLIEEWCQLDIIYIFLKYFCSLFFVKTDYVVITEQVYSLVWWTFQIFDVFSFFCKIRNLFCSGWLYCHVFRTLHTVALLYSSSILWESVISFRVTSLSVAYNCLRFSIASSSFNPRLFCSYVIMQQTTPSNRTPTFLQE